MSAQPVNASLSGAFFALVRREGDHRVEILEIATRISRHVELTGGVTDLDLIADGSRATLAFVRPQWLSRGPGLRSPGCG